MLARRCEREHCGVLAAQTPDCLVYERQLSTERLIVALNFATEPHAPMIPAGHARILASSTFARSGATRGEDLILCPQEGVVLESLNGRSATDTKGTHGPKHD